jgi:hypothetical protein
MHAVVAAALSLSPSPAEVELAAADIHLPYEYPALTERSPRMRVAMLVALYAADAIDPDTLETGWFRPAANWASDVAHARSVVVLVRGTPTLEEGAWLPSREWFAREAELYGESAAEWRRQAEHYRLRACWEPDREEALTGWARHMEAVADGYECERWRYAGWSYRQWNRPRRVLYSELRRALGPQLWERREFPGWNSNVGP